MLDLASDVLTIDVQACENDFGAIGFSPCLAILASMAHVLDWLVASSLTGLELRDLVPYFDDDAGTLS